MIVIDTTISGTTSNSYVTVDEVNQAYADLGVCDAAWCDASDKQQTNMLLVAARQLDRLRFVGSRANPMQAMEWPRVGGAAPYAMYNGRTWAYGIWTPFYGSIWNGIYDFRDRFWPADQIPPLVKQAQIMLLREATADGCGTNGSGMGSGADCGNIRSMSAFGVSAVFNPPVVNVVPDSVMELLGDVILTGSGIVKG